MSIGLSNLRAIVAHAGTDATLFDPLYVKAIYDHTNMSPSARALVMGGKAERLFGLR